MRIALVNPPHSALDIGEVGPPLGLLRLFEVAQQSGWEAQVLDLNLLWHLDDRLRSDFYRSATGLLVALNADVYAFTSMAVDTHVAIELSRRIKIALPRARVLCGGTHFSSIAADVLSLWPWIDQVVTGEGEESLASVLSPAIEGTRPLSRESQLAYAHVDLIPYFLLNKYRTVDVESSRGCRYSCRFCYSPLHYPKRRTLNVDTLVAELSFLARAGARHIFFVDDNFLNDEQRALTVCQAFEEARLGLTWHCYATLPQINPTVLSAMARAGCTALFTGIDAIGKNSQRGYGKRFDAGTRDRLDACRDHGITPTCAFLVAPPSHPCGVDAEVTVAAALAAREAGALVRLNVLTYYPGTGLSSKDMHFSVDTDRIELGLDVPSVVKFNEYARVAPELFPFHARYVPAGEWSRFTQQVHVLFTLLHSRGEELSSDACGHDVSFFGLAANVLSMTGDLMSIDKSLRRNTEVQGFDQLIMHPNSRGDPWISTTSSLRSART